MKKTMIAIASAMTLSTTAAAAQTQDNAAQNQMAQQQAQQKITEGMLVKFVAAMEDVQKVTTKYRDKFQNAENQEEARSIQQEAQKEMIAAVKDSGLSPQQYNMIIQRAQSDKELRSRLKEMTSGEGNS
ncbi:MAG: DUF4168 domain-containing protein [Pseudomonadota bacterium]|nr:DUF4168 domain-containing protein [Pseudomonadota bacterium]